MKKYLISCQLAWISLYGFSQSVGIGTVSPEGQFNIKGSADTSQLVIDANSTQSNTQPLIRLRDASGADIMHIHSDGPYNTFIGLGAGRVNSTGGGGLYNTFIGSSSGYANTVGAQNTAIGRGSFFYNISGLNNTAMGFKALFSNTSGSRNTAVGCQALQLNGLSGSNTAIGFQAMQFNTSGNENVGIGAYALYSNTGASGNVAIGVKALYTQSIGGSGIGFNSFNTAVGSYALYYNQTDLNFNYGANNVALGYQALYQNASGSYNIAIGVNSMIANLSGVSNTCIGDRALSSNNSGSQNVAIGNYSDVDLSNSSYNTIVGSSAHVLGSNNVVIGRNSYTNVNNLALLGSATTAQVGGYANWSNFSDGRFKTDIDENVKGLDFILRLRPVTYHMNVKALYKLWGISKYGKNDSSMTVAMKSDIDESIKNKESIRMSGFIAQEVATAANESGYDFDGVIKPAHDKDHYRLAYGEFVVPLTKAIQEQQAMIEEQKKTIIDQKKLIEQILGRLKAVEDKIK